MRGLGDSKVSTLTVLKCFSEEENPAEDDEAVDAQDVRDDVERVHAYCPNSWARR